MNLGKREVLIIIFGLFTLWYLNSFYLAPATQVSKQSGTVLSDNWWHALNWIKNNTDECSVIATYWDPGHFITGVARRPVVFDGATQNSELWLDEKGKPTISMEETVEKRARIDDIGTTLMTTNETQAVELLERYKFKDCPKPMYFIASSDLIFKSQWWTYFSTWNPVDKGTKYVYAMLQLEGEKPLVDEGVMARRYPAGNNQIFLIYEKNGTMKARFQAGNQFVKIKTFKYYQDERITTETNENAELEGTLLALPGLGQVVYMPPQLENSMFTEMFFYDGENLENFEFVKQWGNEVKLFKVKI